MVQSVSRDFVLTAKEEGKQTSRQQRGRVRVDVVGLLDRDGYLLHI